MAVAHAGTIAILIRTGKGGLRTDGGRKRGHSEAKLKQEVLVKKRTND